MKRNLLLLILATALTALFASTAYSAGTYTYYVPGTYVDQDGTAYLDVLNPGAEPANIDVRIQYEKNDTGGFKLVAEAGRVSTVDLSKKVNGNFGMVITSDRPVVAGSRQYDSTFSAGAGALATPTTDYVWHFAEGYSSGMVKTYLYLLNPDKREANVGVTLYYDTGEKKTFNIHVPAEKHLRVDLKEKTMPEKRFGMKVTSTVPIAASSVTYNKHFSAGSGGVGSTLAAKEWYFPDGYTSVEATDFLNLVNPSFALAHYKATLYYDDGTTRVFEDTLDPQSKKMIMLNNYAAENRWYSTAVESDVDIVAEVTHYDQTYSSGHGGVGATAAAQDVYFAYAQTGAKSKAQIAIFNPSDKEAELELTSYYSDGSVKTLLAKAPSLMRSTIDLNSHAVAGKPFGMRLSSTEPVVAKLVVYDQTTSAGYGYYGAAMLEAEEEETAETPGETSADETQAVTEKFTLSMEEVVATSRFNEKMQAGMAEARKYTYDYDGSSLLVWQFRYSDAKAASKALSAALSGELFTILEVGPEYIAGDDAHYFVSDKSEGYIVLSGNDVLVFVASRGDGELAYELAEMYASGTQPKRPPTGIGTILIVLAALIVLIIFIRWVFRKTPEEIEQDKSVWEDVIPSAKPAQKKGPRKSPVRQQKPRKKKPAKEHPEKEEHKKDHPKREEKKEEHKKEHPEKEPKKDEGRKDFPKKVKSISIKEIPRDRMTAQDILDNLEEIPEYEDVFRHVNREQEEIKQK
ncbi:hypothetical protein KY359_03255 [Candidatus Woesearchaeota archaeon]|nr:hypothetical protein [Candidatus Woesearchaeota archaeon]